LLEEATLTNSYGYNNYYYVNVMATVQLEHLSLSVEEEEEGRTLVDSVGTMLAEDAVGRKRTHTQIYRLPFKAQLYSFGAMYSTICRSQTENSAGHTDPQLITIWCSTVEGFDGGPVLRGYDFQRSKMPVVNGVVLSNASYSISHNTVVFQPDLFWSLCYHMAENGFNAQCHIERYP